MSHVATIEVEVKDLQCLAKAAADLGLELVEGQDRYKWYGRSVGDYPMPEGFKASDLGKCDHAIRIPGNKEAYEIGVVKRGDKFILLWDFWRGGYGLEEKVGANAGLLSQRYATQVAKKAAVAKGFRVQEKKMPNGALQLICSR